MSRYYTIYLEELNGELYVNEGGDFLTSLHRIEFTNPTDYDWVLNCSVCTDSIYVPQFFYSHADNTIVTLPTAYINLYIQVEDPETGDWIWELDHQIPLSAVAKNKMVYLQGTVDYDFSLNDAHSDYGTILCNYDVTNGNTVCIPINYTISSSDIIHTSVIIMINE